MKVTTAILNNKLYLVLIGIALFIIAVGFVYAVIVSVFKRRVIKTSAKYKAIEQLNSKMEFNDIPDDLEYVQYLKSYGSFKNYDIDIVLYEVIEDEIEYFESIIELIKENRTKYHNYLEEIEKIKTSLDTAFIENDKETSRYYKLIEAELIEELYIEPQLNVEIICKKKYISPKGQNQYEYSAKYGAEEICQTIETVKQDIEFKETEEYRRKRERSKLGAKLRYKILERDGFRCKICGATEKDGVKLHVDHIKPIAKGGETTEDNLRTLCDRCNIGKSDSYNEI